MSELIKENTSGFLIDMARLQLVSILGFVLVTSLLLSSVHADYITSQDTIRPDIFGWGIEGEPELGLGFDVWVNVSDADSGLRNVTVQVSGPNMTLNSLLSFNGTFYTGSVPAFPNDGTFSVSTRAYDMENNTRTSSTIYIEFESDPVIPIDPNITMPYVVGGSLAMIVVVLVLARYYDKRRNPA